MGNLEYLEECKEARKSELKTLDTIMGSAEFEKVKIDLRKLYALEIIAEQSIHLDNTLEAVVTTLENIETAIKQRG